MADHGELAPRVHVEADAVQDLPARIIAELHGVEGDPRARQAERNRARRVGDFRRGVDQAEHRVHVDQALADFAIDHAEQIKRAEQLHQQAIHEGDIADGEAALIPAPHHIDQRAGHQRVGDEALPDVEPGEADFGFGGGISVALDGAAIIGVLVRFRVEIFDRFVVQQAVHGARCGVLVAGHHFAAQVGAPIGDALGVDNVRRNHRQRGHHQFPAETPPEQDADGGEFDHGREDIEQQEIEHGVDALGAAFDQAGERAGAAFEVETQRKPVDVAEHIETEVARGFLANLLEQRVAEIVEQHAAEAGQCIGGDQRHRHAGPARQIVGHGIQRQFQRVRHGQHDALGQQYQHHGANDAQLQIGAACRPQIG